MSEDKKIFASPKIRKFARELGANVSQIKGTERKAYLLIKLWPGGHLAAKCACK